MAVNLAVAHMGTAAALRVGAGSSCSEAAVSVSPSALLTVLDPLSSNTQQVAGDTHHSQLVGQALHDVTWLPWPSGQFGNELRIIFPFCLHTSP